MATSPPHLKQPTAFQGSCLCGVVRYTARELVGPYVYCHCQSCRKASGSAYGANISVPAAGFSVDAGTEAIAAYESSPGKTRHFCQHCGSPLYTLVGANPAHVRIRLGSLDTPFTTPAAAHIFVGEAAEWASIDDNLPQFATWPDAAEIDIRGSTQRSHAPTTSTRD